MSVSREEFEALKTAFEEFVSKDVPDKKVKKEKKPKAPSKYNIFIGETVKKLKTENPSTSGKDLFKQAVEAWKKQKEVKEPAKEESKE
jgi:hypothetical protein